MLTSNQSMAAAFESFSVHDTEKWHDASSSTTGLNVGSAAMAEGNSGEKFKFFTNN